MNKQKMEFSKKIFYIVIFLFISVIVFSMALMWKTDNTDALAYLIPSVAGLATTSVGFYYWKAKMENVIKLSKEHNIEIMSINDININE